MNGPRRSENNFLKKYIYFQANLSYLIVQHSMLQISDCTIFLFIEFWDEEEYDKFAVFLKPPSNFFFVEINSNFDFCLPSYLHTYKRIAWKSTSKIITKLKINACGKWLKKCANLDKMSHIWLWILTAHAPHFWLTLLTTTSTLSSSIYSSR